MVAGSGRARSQKHDNAWRRRAAEDRRDLFERNRGGIVERGTADLISNFRTWETVLCTLGVCESPGICQATAISARNREGISRLTRTSQNRSSSLHLLLRWAV